MEGYYENPGIFINKLLQQDDQSDFEEEFVWLQNALKSLNQQLRGTNQGGPEFIGAHPKSLSKAKLAQIKKEMVDWLVCEKTDGVRYLLIILNNGHCYFTGRNLGGLNASNNPYQLHLVKIRVPSQLINPQELQILEMFDGELIIENYPNNTQALNYLIFDTLIHNANNTSKYQYYDRLRCAQEYLELRKVLKKLGPLQNIDFQPLKNFPKIRCILKDFFYADKVRYIFNNYIPLLPHGNDGLIFTKNTFPYVSGTNENIVKWKPPEKNTIDFLICPNKKITVTDSNYGLLELYVMFNQKQIKHFFLFDFIYAKKELIEEVQAQILNQIERLENLGQHEGVKGVVAECKLERLQAPVVKIQALYDLNKNNIYDESRVENFYQQLLRNTELAFRLDSQLLQNQISLLKDIRERIHLKYNFKFNWVIEKYRTDKTSANALFVAQNLLEIISEDLKQLELIEILEKKETLQ
ncbi:unnamed protein product (macronuclear) [Paramecium tetraurelia]|uniref:mRNA capping enzyme adenylation domain-containing protein n=1 Tax=Paramecium tetraurelia TaxID=5888 RepID=A0D0C0_PARTE|nr:uncharacterized protein GSPATT00012039001 [Paramecium tetraurelia]CAK76487.1 unnamed protein product [Paramecium tetraurelia]|eukprot:XP_001443884.1 hypothetical protein (macronuclear) [Paramecium tetraurelia strain d4-2]